MNNAINRNLRRAPEEKRHFRTYTGSLVSAALLLILMAVYFLWNSHQQAIARAGLTTSSLANLLESRVEHDLGRLTSLSYSIEDMARPYMLGQSDEPVDLRSKTGFGRELDRNFVAIKQISIFDARGQLFYEYDPGAVTARQPDFEQLPSAEAGIPYFSDVYISESSGERYMDYGLPVWRTDGQLLGMIVTSINLIYYTDLLRNIEVGEGGLSLVRRTDNSKLILRQPAGNEHDFNHALPLTAPIRQLVDAGEKSGTVIYVASTDHAERLGTFRRLDNYPLYVQVSLGKGTYLSEWRYQALITSIILLAFLMLVVFSIRWARRNMLERIALTQAVTESEQRFRRLFENSLDAVVVLDADGVSACNQAAIDMFGVGSEAEFLTLSLERFFPPLQPDGKLSVDKQAEIREILVAQGKHRFEWLFHRLDTDAEFTAEVMMSAVELDGQIKRLANLRDFTERKQYENTINQLAFYDPLTQLPNRRLLLDRLTQAGVQCRRSQQHGALIFIDLDNFKPLNDQYGHGTGDLLLQAVAARLLNSVRTEDTVARFGGDEFVVLLVNLGVQQEEASAHACSVADKILAALNQPYELSQPEQAGSAPMVHVCSASLGVSLFNGEEQAAEVMQRADRAMYRAKADGRGIVRHG